ncbi:alpha/beta family hydrolase [Streptomyces sp. DSM 44917]|uniref:Alpha/beta family hydrolase n=1 Tax=Streptomyces boetiae TaxID=3075541 RepID=A0ABU2L8K5_9ACTN|nr:alpha/beta family hydrolase [Streptomyces sp. DSM 44917]MDT0307618.1 alpha/beta family hydrolase [Streptomyces sp. DSM 44917]
MTVTPRNLVETPTGPAALIWHEAADPRGVLALGHGAGGGTESPDLAALAASLPALGWTVALVEQPWRVAGKRIAPAPRTLDAAWIALWPAVAERQPGRPVVAGGRSAGARVACRTAAATGAAAVLALSFPLHPPGRPEKSRAEELAGVEVPLLVVQGGRDTFGRPGEFPPGTELVEVPAADHGLKVPASAEVDGPRALGEAVYQVAAWLDRVLPG